MKKASDEESPRIISIGSIDLNKTKTSVNADFDALRILPTQNLVLFPGVSTPIFLVRESSKAIADKAYETGEAIGVFCQLDPETEQPGPADLFRYGTVASVLKVFELPDGQSAALVSAHEKVEFDPVDPETIVSATPGNIVLRVSRIRETKPRSSDKAFEALAATIKELTVKLIEATDGPEDFLHNVKNYPDPVGLVNMICSQAPLPSAVKFDLLAEPGIKARAKGLLGALTEQEAALMTMGRIRNEARKHFEQNQRQAFLQQQMEEIRQELYGEDEQDADKFRKRAESVNFPDSVRETFDKEVEKLSRLNPTSPDYAVQYTYLDTLLSLPWQKYSIPNTDLAKAAKTLDADHFGLKKIKERILEQIAVVMNNPDGKAPILCLVGPPGVGKTSLGRSVADALGRSYQRVSLGGLHDEAEIRGHRRTYIGAMPGRIIEAIRRAGDSNPVLLLDEVDKIGSDFKGDPSAALLEVLDPEQNCHFHDNFIDIDYDLSKVLFIATANTLGTLSQPLLDRMEIVDLSGYLLEEKVEIARRHILPRILKENNLGPKDVVLTRDAIELIVERYTAESGVRQLEKQLAAIVRKLILKKMMGEKVPSRVTPKHVKELLGTERYTPDRYEGNDFPGVVTGLAWTSVGGEILYIESSLSGVKGDTFTLTGNLGNVMKESAQIALQYVKSHASELGIDEEKFEKYHVHLHVPEGAIPKDGPSAGITMATSIASAFTGRKVRARLAMTGEITLRGKVLPVGGIKEKILAAKRAGITDIILSAQNRKDINDIDRVYIEGLNFHYVDIVGEVLDAALLPET